MEVKDYKGESLGLNGESASLRSVILTHPLSRREAW